MSSGLIGMKKSTFRGRHKHHRLVQNRSSDGDRCCEVKVELWSAVSCVCVLYSKEPASKASQNHT